MKHDTEWEAIQDCTNSLVIRDKDTHETICQIIAEDVNLTDRNWECARMIVNDHNSKT